MSRPPVALPLPQARSRVGNGSAVLAGVDGRSAGARRYREMLAQLTQDLADDGPITEARMILARRAALLSIWCECAEAKMANGEAVDISEFTAAANALRRILTDIGLIWPAELRMKM